MGCPRPGRWVETAARSGAGCRLGAEEHERQSYGEYDQDPHYILHRTIPGRSRDGWATGKSYPNAGFSASRIAPERPFLAITPYLT